jgi:hypothetical protein
VTPEPHSGTIRCEDEQYSAGSANAKRESSLLEEVETSKIVWSTALIMCTSSEHWKARSCRVRLPPFSTPLHVKSYFRRPRISPVTIQAGSQSTLGATRNRPSHGSPATARARYCADHRRNTGVSIEDYAVRRLRSTSSFPSSIFISTVPASAQVEGVQ